MPPQKHEPLIRYLINKTKLSLPEAKDLSACFKLTRFNEDDYFLEAGMPVLKIGYLAAGIFRRYIIDGKGNEIVLQFIAEDHFFSDMDGFYMQKPAGTYIQAVTPCLVYVLAISELEILKNNRPGLDLLVSQIGEMNHVERIQSELFLKTGTSSEQYEYFITHSPHLIQQVPLKYIASYLRITQQSLSRIRRKIH